MTIIQRFATGSGIKIEYYDGNETVDAAQTPLFHIPGAMGGGDAFMVEAAMFAPRRWISMSQRGRGHSDAPERGYTLENYVTDVQAVLEDAKVDQIFLFAFSLGVPSALAFAAEYPEKVKGLIIGDYPARVQKLPPEWVDKYTKFPPGTFNMTAVRGVVADSLDLPLADRLHNITCPTLILQGGRVDIEVPAILSAEEAKVYQAHLGGEVHIKVFEDTGHRLWEPAPERFFGAIRDFCNRVEQ